jgi:hypothetical protein
VKHQVLLGYALEAKMTDEQVTKAANNLEIFLLVKTANTYNRYCQSQKTAEANAKLKQFVDLKSSEIYKAGQWLTNALLKVGQDRKQSLLEKDLVHKNDYNQTVTDLTDTIKEQQQGIKQQTSEASTKIILLEKRTDSLQEQLKLIQQYITNNYGLIAWHKVEKYLQNNLKKGD